jgi:hypothetical protein
LSSVVPDIRLMILRFSFSVVKGNLIIALRKMPFGADSGAQTLRRSKVTPIETSSGQLKYWMGFAFEQTRFSLGQVSFCRTG